MMATFERLTARSPKNNMAYLVGVKKDEQDIDGSHNTLKCVLAGFEQLGAYEDSGISPVQAHDLAKKAKPMRLIPNKKIKDLGKCPTCKTELCMDDEDLHYCPTCGQALELRWEEIK